MTFEQARAAFPVLEQSAYLNAGTFGPLSRSTLEAIAAEQRIDAEHGRSGRDWFERVLGMRGELRASLASLVGVTSDQVALTASTTDGCNIVLLGLDLDSGDEVVTTTDEHFGLLGPLGVSRARVVVVPPDPERIVAAVTPRTKLIAVSEVLWTTGVRLPVAELREQTGIPVLVDGAQSVGAVPVDASGVDFLTISGQKWLCGPDATGALVVADPERLRIARPAYFSQSAHEPDGSFVPSDGAVRFEPNWIPAGALAGLAAALDQAPDWRFARAAATAGRFREALARHVDVLRGDATLVSFRAAGEDAEGVVARLAATGVVVRAIPGREIVRASVGYWTSEDDLERLLGAL